MPTVVRSGGMSSWTGHTLSVEPGAMTFGSQIFMLAEIATDPDPDRMLMTTIHEMTHAQQAARSGGFYGFAASYCRAMIAVNYDYDHISLERAAFEVEQQAAHNLHEGCGEVACP